MTRESIVIGPVLDPREYSNRTRLPPQGEESGPVTTSGRGRAGPVTQVCRKSGPGYSGVQGGRWCTRVCREDGGVPGCAGGHGGVPGQVYPGCTTRARYYPVLPCPGYTVSRHCCLVYRSSCPGGVTEREELACQRRPSGSLGKVVIPAPASQGGHGSSRVIRGCYRARKSKNG